MHSIRLAGLAALLLAGCYGPNVVECSGGFLCPEGTACAAPGFCGEPARVEACVDKQDFASCAGDTGTCFRGSCEDCSVDLAGCQFDAFTPMTSPARGALYAVWVASPSRAYAGGFDREVLIWEGRGWSIASDVPRPTSPITSIWGSSENDVYVAAGELLHFDGTSWTIVDGITGAKAVAGRAANDVFVVGSSGAISHFDGSAWQSLSSTGPDFEDVAVGTQMIAVGSFGGVFTSDGTTAMGGQPLPMAIRNAPLEAVTTYGDDAIVVGLAVNDEPVPVIAHFDGTAWTLAEFDGGVPGINMRAVWAAADDVAFAGGYQGTIVRIGADGRWATMEPRLGAEIEAIDGNGREVFAVGGGGAIWRYTLP